jgi:chromosome segregation ATPase
MIVIEPNQTQLDKQISTLESEILQRNSDIQNLQEALATLTANEPRPRNPQTDDAFALLKELVGAVPQSLEEQQLYRAKLAEAQRALELAIAAVEQKQLELDALRQQKREQQQEQALEELKSKAEGFNQLIDAAMAALEAMRSLSKVAGSGTLEIVADPNETPFCQVAANSVKLRRHFDIKRSN